MHNHKHTAIWSLIEYRCNRHQDKKHGHGCTTFINGAKYEGNFKDDKKHNLGMSAASKARQQQ